MTIGNWIAHALIVLGALRLLLPVYDCYGTGFHVTLILPWDRCPNVALTSMAPNLAMSVLQALFLATVGVLWLWLSWRTTITMYDRVKFWGLRHAFWVGSWIAVGAIFILLFASHTVHLVSGSQVLLPFATLLGFYIASLTFLLNQIKASVDEYNRLNEEFNSTEIRGLRARVASAIRTGKVGFDDWEDLFDFFEEIAFKTRLGIIEIQVAYQMFSYWILHYWFHCEAILAARRQQAEVDKDLYSELESMVGSFAIINIATNRIDSRLRWFPGLKRRSLDALRGLFRTRHDRFLKEEEDQNPTT